MRTNSRIFVLKVRILLGEEDRLSQELLVEELIQTVVSTLIPTPRL